MSQLYITPQAREDLERIWLYGLQHYGPAQSDAYITALNDCFQLLVNNPKLYPEYTEFQPAVRIAPVREHLILYITEAEKLTVIRVLHRRQDVSRQL